jgi:hypothetical protein
MHAILLVHCSSSSRAVQQCAAVVPSITAQPIGTLVLHTVAQTLYYYALHVCMHAESHVVCTCTVMYLYICIHAYAADWPLAEAEQIAGTV